jgi:hypothetical protein
MVAKKIVQDSGSACAANSLRSLGAVGLLMVLDACGGVAVTENSPSAAQAASITPAVTPTGCEQKQAASDAPTAEQCTPHLRCAP